MKRLIIILGAMAWVSFSFAQAYNAHTNHSPIFSNKGELQIRMYYATNGFNPQVSYAITDHWGAMINSSFHSLDNTSQNFVEFGGGYYNNVNGRFVYEFFGGYGIGQVQDSIFTFQDINTGSRIGSFTGADFNRFYIQPALGFVTNVFDISISARIGSITFNPDIDTPLQTSTGFFEPAVTVGLGMKYVKIYAQGGFSATFEDRYNLAFDRQEGRISVGLVGRIGRKYF